VNLFWRFGSAGPRCSALPFFWSPDKSQSLALMSTRHRLLPNRREARITNRVSFPITSSGGRRDRIPGADTAVGPDDNRQNLRGVDNSVSAHQYLVNVNYTADVRKSFRLIKVAPQQTCSRTMSASPLKADIAERDEDVRFVPIADVNTRSLRSLAGSGCGLC
jgi:hypothetical protein